MHTVDEKCGCGAEFHWRGDHPHRATEAATQWREQHRHSESTGVCADRPEPLLRADCTADQPWCELRAGHLGAHSDGNGRHWIKTAAHPTQTTDRHDGGATDSDHESEEA